MHHRFIPRIMPVRAAAIASGFTGLQALLVLTASGGHAADAAIVTRNVNQTLNASDLTSYALDVDQNGTTDFTFDADYVPDPVLSVGFDQIEFPFGSTNAAVIDSFTGDGFPAISLLAAGAVVGPASLFSGPNDTGDLYYNDTIDPVTGNYGGTTGYVGFRFTTPAGLSYGYAQVTVTSVNDPANPLNLTIGSITYNTTPNQPVTVPEPASAALGVITIGLLSRRRARN